MLLQINLSDGKLSIINADKIIAIDIDVNKLKISLDNSRVFQAEFSSHEELVKSLTYIEEPVESKEHGIPKEASSKEPE